MSHLDPWPEFDPCDMCQHPEHDDNEDCEQIIGYGHLTGDQLCGCPGSLSQQLDDQRLIGVQIALEAVRAELVAYRTKHGNRLGWRSGLRRAVHVLEDLESRLLSPLPDTGTDTGNQTDSHS